MHKIKYTLDDFVVVKWIKTKNLTLKQERSDCSKIIYRFYTKIELNTCVLVVTSPDSQTH